MGLSPIGMERDWSRGAGAEEKGLRKLGEDRDGLEAEEEWNKAGVDGVPPMKDDGSASSDVDEKKADGVCGYECCWNSGEGCGSTKRGEGDMSNCDSGATPGGWDGIKCRPDGVAAGSRDR